MLKKKVLVSVDELKTIRNYLLNIDRTDYNNMIDEIDKVAYVIGNIIINEEKV